MLSPPPLYSTPACETQREIPKVLTSLSAADLCALPVLADSLGSGFAATDVKSGRER